MYHTAIALIRVTNDVILSFYHGCISSVASVLAGHLVKLASVTLSWSTSTIWEYDVYHFINT